MPHCHGQWRTGQVASLPDGKWAPLYIRQFGPPGYVSTKDRCNPFEVILPLVCRARTDGGGREFNRKPDHVILSHTLEKTCNRLHECCRIVQELQNYHMQELNWPDIGYNFLIGDDGRVYVGRGWNRMGQFSHEFNEKSLSIAFIGNFFNIPPGPMALSAARNLIKCAVIKVSGSKVSLKSIFSWVFTITPHRANSVARS
ncbi:Peptidoglycan recognition protein 4 [Araneus ventricosus]|uniref:Peptidoglycan recognition protein 4 n=1 Tax=Araneus ventricosus TaxID=182803 RepID=A0A4Y2NB01_ARAVE|nr:Peptidoglycan recognition protein 4 [Araneus ventricosus]